MNKKLICQHVDKQFLMGIAITFERIKVQERTNRMQAFSHALTLRS